MEFYDLAIALA